MARSLNKEDGNAAVTVLGVAVVTLLLVVGVIDIGVYFVLRAKAQTAADAASLAAASELIPGLDRDPEGQARRFASANGAKLVECDCRTGSREAQVRVTVPARFFLVYDAASTEVAARARAGVDLAALEGDGSPGP